MTRTRTAVRAALLAAAACAAMLTGCATDGTTAATATPSTAVSAAPAVSIRDPWVKTADTGMSAAFGTLVNTGKTDVTVVSATSTASPRMELHEIATVDGAMVMRPKTGGFVIPAGGTHELAPGGDHLMMMEVTTAVKAGDAVTVTLTLADGGTVEFTAVGKAFAGGNESYAPMTMG
ncbi:copper(I)-binding protein [Allocatelliglobosispora scoriae]|uniref:Copper(I)-binding protein n=1 Tax=Allocatelliglobosispora scoriae TaxID=643052 RepID=A0A841C6H5_9ACTN|nr:copper chaperone PCu(A)C [Allocatelliglobosispora scoriae]MBB5874381.1 copper(I)-binding protein [Allocatelliglobosispora scoriae]